MGRIRAQAVRILTGRPAFGPVRCYVSSIVRNTIFLDLAMPRYTLELAILCLILLWVVGFFAFPVVGNFVHVLLIMIVALVVVRFLQPKRTA